MDYLKLNGLFEVKWITVTAGCHNKLLQQTETPYLWMSGHIVWSCFASQRDPEPFRQAMSLRSRGYITNKKLIGWLFFGRGEDVQERRYSYSTYVDIPIKYPGVFSPSSTTSSDVTR